MLGDPVISVKFSKDYRNKLLFVFAVYLLSINGFLLSIKLFA